MNLIVAPQKVNWYKIKKPTVFLAGGITNCPEWQDEIIEKLKDVDAYVFNPRRKNFPIDDPNAAKEQITWEFDALQRCNIFSMWFSAGKSDQPICMYELGRNLALFEVALDTDKVIVGVEPGYCREQDVRIQTALVDKNAAKRISNNLDDHAKNIISAIKKLSTE